MADPPIYLEMFVSTLYEQRRRRQQYIVVNKGGHIEKDLLNKLNIPCVDLKEFGCPKANELLLIGGNAHTHCSLVECYLFWQWLTKHLDTHLF